jgi:hypothetical protein
MNKHEILVPWQNQNTIWWNETCAMVLEFFGLPGDRYVYTPHVDHMTFAFKDEHDLTLCKILLAGRF